MMEMRWMTPDHTLALGSHCLQAILFLPVSPNAGLRKLSNRLSGHIVTSHQATLWAALRHCRVGAKLPKLGKLFTI